MFIIRTNLELQNVYKGTNIMSDIKTRRLEWLGHVVRMEDLRLPKKVWNAKLHRKQKISKPKLRWFYNIQTDVRTLGLKRWMHKSEERTEWANVRETKVKVEGL